MDTVSPFYLSEWKCCATIQVSGRESFMVSLLQHFYDYKESRLADRNTGLRDLYIDRNAANIAALKDLFVIYTHVVSACCDLDRRTRASGKSCSKSRPHTYMNIPFSFLTIFLERPRLMHEKEA